MIYQIYANENNCFASETTYVSYMTTIMEDGKFYSNPYVTQTTGRHFNRHYKGHILKRNDFMNYMKNNEKWPVFIDTLKELGYWRD